MTVTNKQTEINLRQHDEHGTVTITLENDTRLTGALVDRDHDPTDKYSGGFVSYAFELTDESYHKVNDQADMSVLHLRQSFERQTDRPLETTVAALVYDAISEDLYYESVGTVESLEVID